MHSYGVGFVPKLHSRGLRHAHTVQIASRVQSARVYTPICTHTHPNCLELRHRVFKAPSSRVRSRGAFYLEMSFLCMHGYFVQVRSPFRTSDLTRKKKKSSGGLKQSLVIDTFFMEKWYRSATENIRRRLYDPPGISSPV